MLWKFRYRDKFTAHEVEVEGPSYDLVLAAADAWCKEADFRTLIPNTLQRSVLFTVLEDGTRVQHDPTGKPVEKMPADGVTATTKAKKSA